MKFDFRRLRKEEMLKNANYAVELYQRNGESLDPKLDIKVIDCIPEEGMTIAEYTVPEDFRNTNGLVHGGGICWVADSAMSLGCCASGDGGPNPTIDMTVNFLKPCHIGDVLTCRIYTSHVGRSMSRATLKIYVGEELKAEAVGNYIRTEMKSGHIAERKDKHD